MIGPRGTGALRPSPSGHTRNDHAHWGTAPHDAVLLNRTADARSLLKAGADPEAHTVTGTTFQPFLFRTPDRILLESVNRDRRRSRPGSTSGASPSNAESSASPFDDLLLTGRARRVMAQTHGLPHALEGDSLTGDIELP